METTTQKSPAIQILSLLWQAVPYKSHEHVNRTMQDGLMSVIRADIKFDIDDFEFIFNNFRAGYWMGMSSNGHHYGDHYYACATTCNSSAIAAYEKYFNRQPFIIEGKRVFVWQKFIYNNMFCHITGWSSENDKLMAVGYSEDFDKGKRTLLSFDKKSWLTERKLIKMR